MALPWLLLALLYTPGALYFDRDAVHPNGWTYILLHYLVLFGIWALYTPLIVRLVHFRPLAWPPTPAAVLFHLASATGLVVLHAFLLGVFEHFVPSNYGPAAYLENVFENLLFRGAPGLVLYTATAACLAAWDAMHRLHLRERSLVQARLDALQAQLEPHFLFNTLNAVSELVYRDAEAADRCLTQLAGLLRRLLEYKGHEQTLRDEIEQLRGYAAIQQTLLGERLSLHWQVPPDLLDARVPTFLLQPLLENAIAHGVSQLKRGGAVRIGVQRQNERLQLRLRNDGPASQATHRAGGVGLANTRERLLALYGSQQSLNIQLLEGGGCEVTICLPWRERDLGDGA